MGAPKKFDDATRRWIADLVHTQGGRPGATAATQHLGRPVALAQAVRCHAEFYPGEKTQPAAAAEPSQCPPRPEEPLRPAPAPAKPPAPPRPQIQPPPPPPRDEAMVAAVGQGAEAALELALERAAEAAAVPNVRERMLVLGQLLDIQRELEKVRQRRQQETRQPFRVVELRLPPKEPAP